MITGLILDYAIKAFTTKKVFVEDLQEEHVRAKLYNTLKRHFDENWEKWKWQFNEMPGVSPQSEYSDCLNKLDNWFNWFWNRILKNYEMQKDWNLAVSYSKPKPDKRLYSKKYGIYGKPDGFEFNQNGVLIPLDYKAGKPELTPEIQLQMTYYALLVQERTGKMPDTAKVLFLSVPDPEVILIITEQMITDAINIIEIFRERTKSDDINDYPCMCERCKKEFSDSEAIPILEKTHTLTTSI